MGGKLIKSNFINRTVSIGPLNNISSSCSLAPVLSCVVPVYIYLLKNANAFFVLIIIRDFKHNFQV